MHVHLRVGESHGEPSFEPVHVQPRGGRRYTVEFSPGLAYGVAAGDEIDLSDDGSYKVVTRAGNIAVRVLSEEPLASYEQALSTKVRLLLRGRLDGSISRGLVYTVPAEAGFPSIEHVFNEFVAAAPTAIWEYGNVYAEDGSPLRWWESAA